MATINEMFPPKPTWNVDEIPDLTGQVIIVTGGNTGLGNLTVEALLNHNAKVYLAARSQSKASEAIQDLFNKTGNKAIWLKLDLADLQSIKAAVAEFTSKENHLHVLFNNAGVMLPDIKDLTAQGYDLQFGTNVLGHFYFTKLLLPILISTAQSSPSQKVRVINTSSGAHAGCGKINFSTLTQLEDNQCTRKKLGNFGLYSQSKLGNVILSNELARRYGDSGIISISLNPGNLSTDLQRSTPKVAKFIMKTFILYPPEFGVLTQLWAGTSPEGAHFNGKYLKPWAREGESSAASRNREYGEELWNWMEEQVQHI